MWPAGLASDPRGKADRAGLLCVSRAHSRVSPDSTPQGLATAAGHGRLDQSKATGPGRQRHARGHARSRGAGVTQCRLPWPHSGSAGQRHLPGRTAEPRCSWPRVRRGDLLQDPLPPLPSGAGSGTTGGSADGGRGCVSPPQRALPWAEDLKGLWLPCPHDRPMFPPLKSQNSSH